jgi:hypothetical protein
MTSISINEPHTISEWLEYFGGSTSPETRLFPEQPEPEVPQGEVPLDIFANWAVNSSVIWRYGGRFLKGGGWNYIGRLMKETTEEKKEI